MVVCGASSPSHRLPDWPVDATGCPWVAWSCSSLTGGLRAGAKCLHVAFAQVWNTAYQLVAQRQRGVGEFHFRAFMDGPVTRVRRKPARAR